MDAKTQPLRRALLANAAFSTLTAATMALAGGPLAAAMGLPSAVHLFVVAAGLVPFAFYLLRLARRRDLPMREAFACSVADGGWVVGSALLLLIWGSQFTALGIGLVVVVAVLVGALGAAQLAGIRNATR